jgi:hypothetical protein
VASALCTDRIASTQVLSYRNETVSTHDAHAGGAVQKKSTHSFDVTASVQTWANGATNRGWATIGLK